MRPNTARRLRRAESRNGPTSIDNTVIACAPCNIAKGDSPLGDSDFLRWLDERGRELTIEGSFLI